MSSSLATKQVALCRLTALPLLLLFLITTLLAIQPVTKSEMLSSTFVTLHKSVPSLAALDKLSPRYSVTLPNLLCYSANHSLGQSHLASKHKKPLSTPVTSIQSMAMEAKDSLDKILDSVALHEEGNVWGDHSNWTYNGSEPAVDQGPKAKSHQELLPRPPPEK